MLRLNLRTQENNNAPYSNPELDMISKDIEELSREKLALEADIQQKEADIKIKSGECKSLQVSACLRFMRPVARLLSSRGYRHPSQPVPYLTEPSAPRYFVKIRLLSQLSCT